MNMKQLKEKFPSWKIYQDPDPECRACKGEGELLIKRGSSPCLCVCLSEPHSEDKRQFMSDIGKAARRVRQKMTKEG